MCSCDTAVSGLLFSVPLCSIKFCSSWQKWTPQNSDPLHQVLSPLQSLASLHSTKFHSTKYCSIPQNSAPLNKTDLLQIQLHATILGSAVQNLAPIYNVHLRSTKHRTTPHNTHIQLHPAPQNSSLQNSISHYHGYSEVDLPNLAFSSTSMVHSIHIVTKQLWTEQ